MASEPNRVDTLRIRNMSGGLNTADAPTLLQDNESQQADNVSYDQKGTLSVRKGRTKRYSGVFSTSPVSGLSGYFKSDGTSRLVIAAGTKLYHDEPHLEDKFDTQAQWQEGTVAGHGSTTRTAGSLRNNTTAPATQTQDTNAQANWDAGTKTDVESTVGGVVQLTKKGVDFTKVYDTTIDFQVGTHSNTIAWLGTLQVQVERAAINEVVTAQADFNLGTNSQTSTTLVVDAVTLARQP